MPSKEQMNRKGQTSSKQRPSKPAPGNLNVARQRTHPAILTQRVKLDSGVLTSRDMLQLQRTIGNQAVGRFLAQQAPTIQRAVKDVVVTQDTRTRIQGVNESLVHGTAGRKLKTGDKVRVHDNKKFYSRLQTDRRHSDYRGNEAITAWHKLADGKNEYLRYGTFRFADVNVIDSDESSEDLDDSFYPFKTSEMMYLTDNPNLCEELVTLWIAKRGRLEGYENTILSGIPVISNEQYSRFHEKARTIPKDVKATKESDYIEHLHSKYPNSGAPPLTAKYDSVQHLLKQVGELPSGGMMHVSLRKESIHTGGHAIGIARMKTQYYIFDPNTGIARLSDERLAEAIRHLLATARPSAGIRQGSWAEYKLFYAVTVPDTRFKGIRKY